MKQHNRLWGAILLVSGTCIGAGMLALPIVSSPAGFYYAILLLIVSWIFMTLSAFYVMEVNLSLQGEPSYLSMAYDTLGEAGWWFTWVAFLGLLYALLAAYLSGGADIINQLLTFLIGQSIPPTLSILIWVLFFSFVLYKGVELADIANRWFMTGLIFTFLLILYVGLPEISFSRISNGHFSYSLAALPVVFTSMAYHIVIPTVRMYLHGNKQMLKQALIIGSLIPLLVYIAWELLIFALLPASGSRSMEAILDSGHVASQLAETLSFVLQQPLVAQLLHLFIFFAITSSFVGIAYGLYDFLEDGLQINKDAQGKRLLIALTFAPPLIFALYYPQGFIFALKYAGIFVAIVHGILPVIMVWQARYIQKEHLNFMVPGGRPLLILVFLFFIFIIVFDVMVDMGMLPKLG